MNDSPDGPFWLSGGIFFCKKGLLHFAFFALSALNFAQRAFVALEIAALAAADITRRGRTDLHGHYTLRETDVQGLPLFIQILAPHEFFQFIEKRD